MASAGDWCLIESDPGVFTQLIGDIGVEDVEVEEIFAMDESLLSLPPSYGLIFLFNLKQSAKLSGAPTTHTTHDAHATGVFFAKQVLLTLNVILLGYQQCLCNSGDSLGVDECTRGDVGEWVDEFQRIHDGLFTRCDYLIIVLTFKIKGLAISNSNLIRSVHNSFARFWAIVSWC